MIPTPSNQLDSQLSLLMKDPGLTPYQLATLQFQLVIIQNLEQIREALYEMGEWLPTRE